MPNLLWFTRDLRLEDHPALAAAGRDGEPVIAVYILDDEDPDSPRGASRWWLHHSLLSLGAEIETRGGRLILQRGPTRTALRHLLQITGASGIYCSRANEPWLAQTQIDLHAELEAQGTICKRFGGRILFEPDRIFTGQGKPFQVFTPFYRHVLSQHSVATPVASHQVQFADFPETGDLLDTWNLLPKSPNWAVNFPQEWQPGAGNLPERIEETISEIAAGYDGNRDVPAADATSRFSPHLAFGEISPRQLWQISERLRQSGMSVEAWRRQLVWRDFNYYLLHHWPLIVDEPFQEKFARFPWRQDDAGLTRWQTGQTGYPLVDAGMRQLWQTGWMHNRVRMITASFLTKHLRIHWKEGVRWFQDTLLDADLANNIANWQWVAGSGADAAPYFRIFNPVLQGERFDPRGHYVRRWVPELARLPDRYIHKPWHAPAQVLQEAGVRLDIDYPAPMVDHATARAQALAAYAEVK